MKICMVYNTDGHWLGVHVVEIVERMAKLGVTIHLLIPKTDRIPQSENIKVHLIASKHFSVPFFGVMLQSFSAIRAFRRLAKEERIDMIYMRSLHFAAFFSIYKKFARFRLMFEMNGISADEQVLNHKWLRPLKFFIAQGELFVARNATAIIPVTSGIKIYLEKQGVSPNRITVVENGANLELFKPLEYTEPVMELRKQLGICPEEKVVVFVGTLYPWQGVEDIVNSAPLVLKESPEAKFLIVGDGLLRQSLEESVTKSAANGRIIFVGRVPYEEVPIYVNMADVCAAPKSSSVGAAGLSPLKIYEYMACGKAVVATKLRGLEFIEQNNAGLLVTPGDQEELSQAIARLLNNPGMRQQMGENGRHYVLKNRSWETVAKKVAEVCGTITGAEVFALGANQEKQEAKSPK